MVLLIITGPYLSLIIHFAITDPFRLNTYPPYIEGFHHINRGVVTTNGYLQLPNINAVILGNSRSISIRCDDWTDVTGHCDSCFHFDASNDNLHGFNQKVELLHSKSDSLRCALILLDDQSVSTTPRSNSYAFARHPIYGELNKLDFYWAFLKQYLNIKYQYAHLKKNGTGHKHWVSEFSYAQCDFNPNTADYITAKEKQILQDSIKYYTDNPDFESIESDSYYDLSVGQLDTLVELVSKLESLGAQCNILFQPRYKRTHPTKSTLDSIAARLPITAIYDATYYNRILDSAGFWYERSHFRPIAGRLILEEICSGKLSPHSGRH